MLLDASNPWLSQPHHTALVPVSPHHSLWASVSGPIRLPKSPLLIFFTGAGGPCAEYVKLQQGLSSFLRVLFYDRAGYDQSTLPPCDDGDTGKIVARDTVHDLAQLLATTGLKPPYILMGHSFGGIPARTFLASYPDDVVGMMLFDTATELMLALHPRSPPLELEAVAKNVDFVGLTHLREDSGMSQDEWDYVFVALRRTEEAGTAKREDTHASGRMLAHEHQLDNTAMGDRPLSIVRCNMEGDYQFLYDEGVKNGDGTEEERKVARDFIEKWGLYEGQVCRAQCSLGRDVHFKHFGEWGHDLPIRKPAIAVEEVRKLVQRVKKRMDVM